MGGAKEGGRSSDRSKTTSAHLTEVQEPVKEHKSHVLPTNSLQVDREITAKDVLSRNCSREILPHLAVCPCLKEGLVCRDDISVAEERGGNLGHNRLHLLQPPTGSPGGHIVSHQEVLLKLPMVQTTCLRTAAQPLDLDERAVN